MNDGDDLCTVHTVHTLPLSDYYLLTPCISRLTVLFGPQPLIPILPFKATRRFASPKEEILTERKNRESRGALAGTRDLAL